MRTSNIWDETAWSDPIYFDNGAFGQDVSGFFLATHMILISKFCWDVDGKACLLSLIGGAGEIEGTLSDDLAIYVSEVDIRMGKSSAKPKAIRPNSSQKVDSFHIVKRDQYCYCFSSETRKEPGFQTTVSRSENGPLGPWEQGPKVALSNSGSDAEVRDASHMDVFEDNQGKWWAVLSACRSNNFGGEWEESPLGKSRPERPQ